MVGHLLHSALLVFEHGLEAKGTTLIFLQLTSLQKHCGVWKMLIALEHISVNLSTRTHV